MIPINISQLKHGMVIYERDGTCQIKLLALENPHEIQKQIWCKTMVLADKKNSDGTIHGEIINLMESVDAGGYGLNLYHDGEIAELPYNYQVDNPII